MGYTDEFKKELGRRYSYYKLGGEMVRADEADRQITELAMAVKCR